MICDECENEVPVGESYHSLVLAEEVRRPDGVEVLDEIAPIQLCRSCAARFDFEEGVRLFSSRRGTLVSVDELNHVGEDTCDSCGSGIADGPYHSLVHHEERFVSGLEVEVVEAVAILQLCEDCRREFDFGQLRLAPR